MSKSNRDKQCFFALKWGLLVVTLLLGGCGASAGSLLNKQVALGELPTDRQPIFVVTKQGVVRRVSLDGADESRVYPTGYILKSVSANGRVAALVGPQNNLYVQRDGGEPVRVGQVDGAAGMVALSADGAQLATAGSAGTRLYLINTGRMDARVVPIAPEREVSNLRWSKDGAALWVKFDDAWGRVDAARSVQVRGSSEPDLGELVPVRGAQPHQCSNGPRAGVRVIVERFGAIARMSLVPVNGGIRKLVEVRGKGSGFNREQPPVSPYFFSDSCELIVFGFDARIWVVDVDTGHVSPLTNGLDAFVLAR